MSETPKTRSEIQKEINFLENCLKRCDAGSAWASIIERQLNYWKKKLESILNSEQK